MKENIICPHCSNTFEQNKNPLPTVDVIVEIDGKIVLVRRKNPPYGWAIPGGFIDYGECAENAARREMREELNIDLADLKQFHCYSDPSRDPRSHTITIVFTAISSQKPVAGDDALEAILCDKNSLPSPLAFDHAQILSDYFNSR